MAQIFLVHNPASGAKTAGQLLDIIRPRLAKHHPIEFKTESEGDGERVGQEIRKQIEGRAGESHSQATIILSGGDGTTHEVLNGLYDRGHSNDTLPEVRLVIVPTGTANALYASLYPPRGSSRHRTASQNGLLGNETLKEHSWRIQSLQAYLDSLEEGASEPRLYLLTITQTTLKSSDLPSSSILGHLVTSTALHASILYDSEKLREEHPGIERFKLAAQQNMTNWHDGQLVLHGDENRAEGSVQRYNPDSRRFDSMSQAEASLEGPIFYLASFTTDRLEPAFVPAPFSFPASSDGSKYVRKEEELESLSRPPEQLDLVVIRPALDPLVQKILSTEPGEEARSKARQAFAENRAMPVTMGMYNEGSHVDLRYPDEANPDEDLEASNQGDVVVEYYRASSWRWIPQNGAEKKSRLTCIDGTVIEAAETSCKVLKKLAGKVKVYW